MDERACSFLLEFSLSLAQFRIASFPNFQACTSCGDRTVLAAWPLDNDIALRPLFTLPGLARTTHCACLATAGAMLWSGDRDTGRRQAWCRASGIGSAPTRQRWRSRAARVSRIRFQ